MAWKHGGPAKTPQGQAKQTVAITLRYQFRERYGRWPRNQEELDRFAHGKPISKSRRKGGK